MDNQFVLRRADISDIDALSQLYQKTVRETFVEDLLVPYSEKDLDSYFTSSASPQSFANKIVDPKRAVWLIEDKINGELVACAVVGPCEDIPHDDVCPNKDAQLNRLFIQRDRRNHGFGQQLMNVILPWSKEHYPGRPIWLSVFFKNVKAQKLYAHYGFTKVGEYDYSVGESRDHEFIMKRDADTS